MKSNIDSKYIALDVTELKQFNIGTVAVGTIRFADLMDVHRLTERTESNCDPFGTAIPACSEPTDEEFQRRLSPTKLAEIRDFLEAEMRARKEGSDALGLFPGSLIIAFDKDEEYDHSKIDDKFLEKMYSPKLTSVFLSNDDHLYVPRNPRIALIVDGQHRLYGLKQLRDSLTDKNDIDMVDGFEFAATFLIGFDIYQLGRIFATVNFKQKPVNRSLYYDIFGSLPDTERNSIRLAHDLALHLNNSDKSPIQGMIKLLGRGYGLFSQAFFVEKLLIHFKDEGVWASAYADYLEGGKQYLQLPTFMRTYLSCWQEAFPVAWPTPISGQPKPEYSPHRYDYILCKTTGFGAVLLLIKDIYPQVAEMGEAEAKNKILRILHRLSDKEAQKLFSKTESFGGTGGEGLQVKLYKHLRSVLNL